jgi:hypothetical protein
MKRDRTVASGSTIEGGGAILISPSRVQETGSGTGFRTTISAPSFTTRGSGHITLVAYPEATVSLGNATTTGIADCPSGFGGVITYAKLDTMGLEQAVTIREFSDIIGPRIRCPNGRGSLGLTSRPKTTAAQN